MMTGFQLLLLGALALAAPEASTADAKPACVLARAEARYGAYGYDHWVMVANGCVRSASCSVVTDVSPETVVVDVPKGESRDVLTFRGSPAREFHARVRCKLGD
jgi:hypothetical protein